MIHTLALTKTGLIQNVPLDRLSMPDVSWFWVDFESPTQEETCLLGTHFKFHDLAIEDCMERLERPKVDYYDTYNFFVLHALNQDTLGMSEVDLFVGGNYVVSFHKDKLQEIDGARQRVIETASNKGAGPTYIAYLIFDKIVDYYFPAVYRIEDYLSEINIGSRNSSIQNLIDHVFSIRTDLLKLRHIVNSMKELLYRILNADHLEGFRDKKLHFRDIHDHLLRLSDLVESEREVTSDVRDNYLSIISHRMNQIMTVLTVVTSIFIPLTFIAGIYGMNFRHMPELEWRYGYFIIMGIMAVIGLAMYIWFKRKGWFDLKK